MWQSTYVICPLSVSFHLGTGERWAEGAPEKSLLLPFPAPGHLPDPGMEPRSPALQADSLPSEPPGKPPKKLWVYPVNVTPSHELRHKEINQDQFQENKQRRFIQSLLEQGRQPGPLHLAEVPKQRAAGMGGFPGEERGRKIPASCSEAADLGELEVGQIEWGGSGGGGRCPVWWVGKAVQSCPTL